MWREKGFTIIELSTAMVAGAILVLAMGSILVISTDETTNTTSRVQVQRDMMILDEFIRSRLANTIGDSLLIYADSSAEASGNPLSIGSIGTVLRTYDVDGNSHRVAVSHQNLYWKIGSTSRNIVDAEVLSLTFQGVNTTYSKKLNIAVQVLAREETFSYHWAVSLRN